MHGLLAANHVREEINGLLHIGHRDPGVIVSAQTGDAIGAGRYGC
jgi:hypothetical protein